MITSEELSLLKSNKINVSKVTYNYILTEEALEPYYVEKFGTTYNHFLLIITDKLSLRNDIKLEIARNKTNLLYLYNDYKLYIINVSHTRIIFNNVDYEDINGLNEVIFNLLELKESDLIKSKYTHITYRIDFGSYDINHMIKSFNNELFQNSEFIHKKKKCINYDDAKQGRKSKRKLKIRLCGRNKWLISQNANNGSIDDFVRSYKSIKNVIILPNLLKNLLVDTTSLFSSLLPEIIDIIINMLIEAEKIERYLYNQSFYHDSYYKKFPFHMMLKLSKR